MNIIIWCSNKRDQITPLNIKRAYQTISVIFENFYPIYRIISEKLSLKSPNFYKDCMNVGMYAQFDQLFQLSTYLYIAVKVSNNLVGSVKQKAFKQRPQVNMGFQWWRQCYQYTDKEGVGVWGTWSSGDSSYVLEKTCERGRLCQT